MNTARTEDTRRLPPCTASARWKHLEGEGETAIYRASCGAVRGKGLCHGHLGDLAHFKLDIDPDENRKQLKLYQLAQKLVRDGDERWRAFPGAQSLTPDQALEHFIYGEDICRKQVGSTTTICANGADIAVRPGWQMRPTLLDGPVARSPSLTASDPLYRGFADTGYIISRTHQRIGRDGSRAGRRPTQDAAVRNTFGRWHAEGQFVVPECKIRCPACGALNLAPWPEEFKGGVEIPLQTG